MIFRTLASTALAAIAFSWFGSPLGAQSVVPSVTIDGSPVTFDQPPIERAGRLYVPLRGVFERLGASVVFERGTINATKGTTTIALTIGSTNATVNGQAQSLDSPPFEIAGRTLVPLRFISQALGATVSYDSATQTVAIVQGPQRAGFRRPLAGTPLQPQAPAALIRPEPAIDTRVESLRPQISATFPFPVDPNSVRIRLDDRDVTAASYVAPRGLVFDPTFDLPPGVHEIEVAAQGTQGRIRQRWSFTTAIAAAPNMLDELQPRSGDAVGSTFIVRGLTRPGAHVTMIATSQANVGFGDVNEARSRAEIVAGPDGRFEQTLTVFDLAAGVIDVRIESRSPQGATIVKTLRLRPNR